MLVTAGILIGTTQLIPQIFQTNFGYTATLAGLTLTPGGFMAMAMMPVVGFAMRLFRPKYIVIFGLVAVGLAMYHLTGIDADVAFGYAVLGRVYQTFGIPFAFITVTTACYIGLPPQQTNLASSLINVARNLGGSIGVSVSQTLLAERSQFHQSRLVENVFPAGIQYQDTIHNLTNYFVAQGSNSVNAMSQAVAWIGQQVQLQATMLSYIDVFFVMSVLAFAAVPLALLMRE
jgi:DHA2 family multidrug resistance protein